MVYADSATITVHVSPSAGANMKFYILRGDQFTKALVSNITSFHQMRSSKPCLVITTSRQPDSACVYLQQDGDTTLATVPKVATATCTGCTSVTLSATGLGVVQQYVAVAVNDGEAATTVAGK